MYWHGIQRMSRGQELWSSVSGIMKRHDSNGSSLSSPALVNSVWFMAGLTCL